MKKLSLLILILALGCSNDKEDDNKPSIPKYIDGRLYCKVDSKEWKSCTKLIGPSESISEWFEGSYLYMRFANSCDSIWTGVYIRLNEPIDTGIFILDKHNYGLYYTGYPKEEEFYSNEQYKGRIHIIKFDRNVGLISGTFDFFASDSSRNNIVHVSDAHFTNLKVHVQ
jgi:hypothetical protein